MYAIGIDVGGTTTRVGIVASDSALVSVERFETGEDFASLLDAIAVGVSSVIARSGLSRGECSRAGLAVPGLIDGRSGQVTRCINLPFLEGRHPVELLPVSLRADALVLSDAEAATWGEFAAREESPKRYAHLRLGTGVACGVVVDGLMVELGRPKHQHAYVLVFDDSQDAVMCKCGQRGCLEAVASRGAVGEGAGEIVESASRAVAIVIRRIAAEYAIEVVSLGGGVVAEFPAMIELVLREVESVEAFRVEGCLLGDYAGVVGAGVWALRRS